MSDPNLALAAQAATAAPTAPATNPAPAAAPEGVTTPAQELELAYQSQLGKPLLENKEALAKLAKAGRKIDNLADSYLKSQEELESYKTRTMAPGKDATPEQINAFWKAMGRPDAPDGYQFDRSGELEALPKLPGLDEFTAELYHKLNLPKDVAETLWKENAKKTKELMAEMKAQREAAAQEGVKELEKLWGREAPQKREELLQVAKKSMDPKDFQAFADSPLANSASFLNWMSGFKKYMSDSPIITGSGAAGPSEPKDYKDALKQALSN